MHRLHSSYRAPNCSKVFDWQIAAVFKQVGLTPLRTTNPSSLLKEILAESPSVQSPSELTRHKPNKV